MHHPVELHPDVYPTGDGERSTAGSNYGDWRPSHGPLPHGYDFESRFVPPAQDPDFKPASPQPPAELANASAEPPAGDQPAR